MKIGYECMLTGPRDTGVGVSIRELLHALLALPGDHTLVLYTHGGAAVDLPAGSRVSTVICALPAWGKAARAAWQQWLLSTLLRDRSVDVYHGPGYIVPPKLPLSSVVSVYDTIALERRSLTTRANAAHYRWAVPRAVGAAQRVIVPSDYVRKRLVHATGVNPRKISVVPLGVSGDFRPLDPVETSNRLREIGLDDQSFLLCVGNIERKKNLDAALHALAGVRAKLVLVGRPGNAYRALRRHIAARGLAERVVFPGYVSRRTLVALYNGATAFLYPSYEEGFGLPPLEAMACGTPVVASNAGALPEIAGAAALLVDPEDHDRWSRTVARLMAEPNLRRELRERGLAHAARFSWARTAAEVLDLYRGVAAHG
ncbi:MAG: glycosyltransferase family 1 protein [FCB group bacterium]|jgi:glycosyltransferase involved in cell wall biosynthesis|nr:glycosyltransferase family 1 protein [FCB group bacterium]